MATTPINGFRYPVSTNAPNVPQDIQNLASDVDIKMPRGELAYVGRTSQAGPAANGAGWVNVSGLTVSVTLTATRKITTVFSGEMTSDTVGLVGVRIWNTTSNNGKGGTIYIPVANAGQLTTVTNRQDLTAGSYTFAVQMSYFGANAYLTSSAAELWILDMGQG